MRARSLLVVPVLLALTACSGPAEADAPAPTVTVTATVTASPEPVVVDEPLEVGDSADFGNFSVTLHAYDADPITDGTQPEQAGGKWAAVDVELCSTDVDDFISPLHWNLVDEENRHYETATSGYESFPIPAFLIGDDVISPGECRRGWLTYSVNGDSDISLLKFRGSPYSETENGMSSWSLNS